MVWRLAKSLDKLREQLDLHAPYRSRVSDGTIGDAAHAASKSDHNPEDFPGWGLDIVTARDVTHDRANGMDCNELAEQLRASKDARIKYVIWNRRMFSSYATSTRRAWEWGPYSGDNPHDKHLHVSVVGRPLADDRTPWRIYNTMTLNPETERRINRLYTADVSEPDAGLARNLRIIRDGRDPAPKPGDRVDYYGLPQIQADLGELLARPAVPSMTVQITAAELAGLFRDNPELVDQLGRAMADELVDQLAARLGRPA